MSVADFPALTMLTTFLLSICAAFGAQQPAASTSSDNAELQELLTTEVLVQGDKTYLVQDVLKELYRHDSSLKVSLESNSEYLQFYINSLRFYDQVRWFSNKLILDAEAIPKVKQAAIEHEALAWSAARSDRAGTVASSLALAAFEIEVMARLIGQQPEEFSNQEIRTHFNSSIPEFFGLLKISWIRIPMFDMETNTALGQDQRKEVYQKLDKVGQQLNDAELTWDEAVEAHSEDPVSKDNGYEKDFFSTMLAIRR